MKPYLLAFALCGLTACNSERISGPSVTETKRGNVEKAEMLSAEINIGAGELEVYGAASKEIVGDFRYSSGGPTPNFRFDNSSFRARAVFEQKLATNLQENKWRIQLPQGIPTDLDVYMGAGESRLKLGTLDLRKVNISLGAGRVVADFLGDPKRDFEVKIRGGVGECEVLLPRGVGVRAEAQGGIGSLKVDGLTKKGDAYESADFSNAKNKIRLSVHGGVGEIRILVR